ncbi:hypothetical protein [Actinomadura citrea]|uniref:Uncharacterized protein n=1 Tax=Actinomadura citrea TaxID=46158 RepID=A0A7Y9GE57_9ACTN|nr:hypothetical protein [Actinomadura citrea]NYE14854.1 hypothetical protein [Actinomadura citrea]
MATLGVEHREESVEAFRQKRVHKDCVRHCRGGELAQHGDLDHGHHLAAFAAKDFAAQNTPAIRVDDGLLKLRVSPVSIARMTALIGSFTTRIARPSALASRSGHAGAAKLRVDEHRVRDNPVSPSLAP